MMMELKFIGQTLKENLFLQRYLLGLSKIQFMTVHELAR